MKTDFWMDGWLDDSTQLCFLNSYGIDLLWCLASRRYEMIVKLRGFNCESETCNNNKGRSGWNLCCAFVSGLADNVEMSLSRRRSGNFVFVCAFMRKWKRESMQEREREREYVWLQLSAVWEKCFDARCDSHFPQYITLSGCTFLPSATTIQTPRAFRSTGAGESITQTAAEAVRVGWCWWCLLGLCAREEVIPLSKAGLWKYSTLAQMAPMTHVTRHLPFLLDNAHQLDLLYTHIHTHSLSRSTSEIDAWESGPVFLWMMTHSFLCCCCFSPDWVQMIYLRSRRRSQPSPPTVPSLK